MAECRQPTVSTRHRQLRSRLAFTLALALALTVAAQEEEPIIDADARAWIAAQHLQAKQAFADNPDVLVLPGLTANRATRRIELLAVGTGVPPANPLEFFVVAENGRDYESLTVTPVKPSDIHRALQFIGLAPGRPVNNEAMLFWPKGERVIMHAQWRPKEGDEPIRKRVEELVWNRVRGETLAATGLTFVGSQRLPDPETGAIRYEGDVLGGIASDYNDPWTVLDVPYRCAQGKRYDQVGPNPKYLIALHRRVRLIIEPEYPPGKMRVGDYTVRVLAGREPPATAADLALQIATGPRTMAAPGPLSAFLAVMEGAIKDGRDPFVRFSFDKTLPLRPLRELCVALDAIAGRDIIRIEPESGRPYYQAFLPQNAWRDRNKRPSQPLEVHLDVDANGRWHGKLVHIREDFTEQGRNLTVSEEAFETRADLIERLKTGKHGDTDVLFLYAAPDLSYGNVVDLYSQCVSAFPTFYILLPPPPGATPAPTTDRDAAGD